MSLHGGLISQVTVLIARFLARRDALIGPAAARGVAARQSAELPLHLWPTRIPGQQGPGHPGRQALLSLAAAQNWHLFHSQLMVCRHFSMMNIYIQPSAQYVCQAGHVLKLCKAVYCLHRAAVKFKQGVTAWFQD